MNSRSASLMDVGSSLIERRGVLGGGFGISADLALLTIAAIGTAHLIWVVLSPTAFVDLSLKTSAVTPSSAAVTYAANPQIFSRFDPFNRDLNTGLTEISEDAPETKLNLVIRSLFASTEPGLGSVRIGLPDGNDQRFQEGDTIVTGVTLDRILSDRIILLRSGEREVLYEREKRVLDLVTEDGQPIIDPTPDTQISNGPVKPDLSQTTVRISDVDDLLNRLQLRREVAPDGGAPELVVFSGSDPTLLSELGLQVKDVLLDVNGFNLREESLADLADQLRAAQQLEFRIRRNNDVLSRTVTLGKNDGE